VVEALDQVEGLLARPQIKWVNDILLGKAKVAGILAYTQSRDTWVNSAVLGFGLNVETTPFVEPTPFVPEAGSLRDFLEPGTPDAQAAVLFALLQALERNYNTLLSSGTASLLERYRDRSMVMGREVTVCSEASDEARDVVAQGRVTGLGEKLELILEGVAAPVTNGRLILGIVDEKMERRAQAASAAAGARSASESCSRY
jgi:BirA family biotin operon repressor/biotin-[acetyl-CoA-carboxylase] ligase